MKAIVLFGLILLVSGLGSQGNNPVFPELNRPVTQLYPLVGYEQVIKLEEKIIQLEEATGSQIAILILPSTKPLEIEEYSLKIAEKWKLGRKGIDDGILIVVAKNDRKVRIEVGYGLEGVIPDVIAKEIIDVYLTPNFKRFRFYEGLSDALNYIENRVTRENFPNPGHQKELENQKLREENIRKYKISRLYEQFVYFNILLAIAFGIFCALKNWNMIGFIVPGIYLAVLLLIGQFFISGYFSEGYFIIIPSIIGYGIIYFIINFRKLDELYAKGGASYVANTGSRISYSSKSNTTSDFSRSSGSHSTGSFRSSSSLGSSRSSSRSYSGGGGSFGGGGASGSW